ncbi:MAG: glycosyltransferase [Bacillota bacterium]|nr:glycosyltransferase [Bacillota bacterium]
MKVLLCIRENYITDLAGDSVQMLTIAKFLRDTGLEVHINCGSIVDYSPYDIIHLFNLTRISETYKYYKNAKYQKKPIVITPIYWNLEKFYLTKGNIEQRVMWERYKIFRNEILNGCKMIYPSSMAEMEMLKNEFGDNLPFTIVYNCLDKSIFNNKDNIINDEMEQFVFCSARVCPRKNQLTLSKICNEIGVKLLLSGNSYNELYLKECLKHKNVSYTGHILSNELKSIYQSAKLHILCSFVETPGLSNLEAAACGCNIISTSEGSSKEYFGDYAIYCNPYCEADIYKAILQGLSFNSQPHLQDHVLENFSMEICLPKLYESYMSIVG